MTAEISVPDQLLGDRDGAGTYPPLRSRTDNFVWVDSRMNWSRLFFMVSALLLAVRGGPAVADPRSKEVPAAWSGYAAEVSQEIQVRLGDDRNAAAARLHSYLDDLAAKNPHATPPAPVVRLWIDRAGRISQVKATSLGDPQMDRDLRQILTAIPAGPPPRDLRQPLILRLRLAYPA